MKCVGGTPIHGENFTYAKVISKRAELHLNYMVSVFSVEISEGGCKFMKTVNKDEEGGKGWQHCASLFTSHS